MNEGNGQPGADRDALRGLWLFPFIAPPNGGKGTQTTRLSQLFQMPRVDMGAALRRMSLEDTDLGRKIKARLDHGHLVDTDIVMEVLEAELLAIVLADPKVKAVILDGFPRSAGQVNGLMDLCDRLGLRIARAFYLRVPAEVIIDRAVNRRICPRCAAIYNLLTRPPKVDNVCDKDMSPLIQRPDDRPDTVRTRLASFEEDTRPIVQRFRDHGTLVKVDGDRPVDDITAELVSEIQPFLSTLPAAH